MYKHIPILAVSSLFWSYPLSAETVEGIIELTNGDRLTVYIIKQDKQSVTIEHSVLGQVTIKREKISAIFNLDLSPMPTALLPEKQQDQGLFYSGILIDWKRRLQIGAHGAKGVSDNLNIKSSFVADYEDNEDRWHFLAEYLYDESDNETSQNKAHLIIDKDWLVSDSKWFYFADGRFEWDEFKDWDYRFGAFIGPGYEFVKNDTWYFRGITGLGVNQTIGEEENTSVEALLGIETGWNITSQQLIEFKSTFYPGLTDLGEYRNISTLDWSHELDYLNGLAVKLGFFNEYDTQQSDGTDFRYHFSIVWDI